MENKIFFDLTNSLIGLERKFNFKDPLPPTPRKSGKGAPYTFTGKYSIDNLKRVINAAGGKIDPAFLSGLAMTESGIGKKGDTNLFHVNMDEHAVGGEALLDYLAAKTYKEKGKVLDDFTVRKLSEFLNQGLTQVGAAQKWQTGSGKINKNAIREGKRVVGFAQSFRENPTFQTLLSEYAIEHPQSIRKGVKYADK